MHLFKVSKVVHKWVSVIVGIQLMIWVGTGLYFNLVDAELTNGNIKRQKVEHRPSKEQLARQLPKLMPIAELSIKQPQQIRLIWIAEVPYYQVTTLQGAHDYQKRQVTLLHAITGKPFDINGVLVGKIALQSFNGKAEITSIDLLEPPITELPKQENNTWQVTLGDALNTSIYIDSLTGKVIAHINDDRRFRDLMFKLHFMDYGNTGGFNHWLIVLFAIMTLALSFTGVIWLIQLYRTGQLAPRWYRKWRKQRQYLMMDSRGE